LSESVLLQTKADANLDESIIQQTKNQKLEWWVIMNPRTWSYTFYASLRACTFSMNLTVHYLQGISFLLSRMETDNALQTITWKMFIVMTNLLL